MSALAGHRRAGLLIPLFAFPSSTSWGIGDIGDLAPMTTWLSAAGQRVLQLLPINEMAPGQQSPYSAISAMAIDPIYISVPRVPEFAALGGERALDADATATLDRVRADSRVPYDSIRALKQRALQQAFSRFYDMEWCPRTERASQLTAFVRQQSWWLDDYALFKAIHASRGGEPWSAWPEGLRCRHPEELDRARQELSREVLQHQFLQWVADRQWQQARAAARGVALFGDLPFMVDANSADVWAFQGQFRLDASLGVPPDAFSASGQDWGMPVYRWDAVVAADFRWLRDRARRAAQLFDGFRVDHLVGFYRTYGRPHDGGEPFFTPEGEDEQKALGERVLEVLGSSGAEIIAEDLGTVPDFVRESRAALGVPGFSVLRWERDWHVAGQPFRDPVDYPRVSVATSGTHDTESLMVWWRGLDAEDRQKIDAIPTIQRLTAGAGIRDAPDPVVRDLLLESLFASTSYLVELPIQDVFGWPDRINEPATVSDENWSFRLPWPCDRMGRIREARERQKALRTWTERYDRGGGVPQGS
jgi:4-alpha-glucanotransferase